MSYVRLENSAAFVDDSSEDEIPNEVSYELDSDEESAPTAVDEVREEEKETCNEISSTSQVSSNITSASATNMPFVFLGSISSMARLSGADSDDEDDEDKDQGAENTNNANQDLGGVENDSNDQNEQGALIAENPNRSSQENLLSWWKWTNVLFLAHFVPLSIAFVVVMIIDRDNLNNCESLWIWSWVQLGMQISIIVILLFLHYRARMIDFNSRDPRNSTQIIVISMLYGISRFLNFLLFLWLIVGSIWVFDTLNHAECNGSHLYKLATAVLIIELIAIGLVAVMICCCCVGIVVVFVINPERFRLKRRGATQQMIDKLEEKTFVAGLIEKESAHCAVCLAEYESDQKLRFLPCRHHFHSDCINQWLLTNKSCPFCKRNIDDTPQIDTPDDIPLEAIVAEDSEDHADSNNSNDVLINAEGFNDARVEVEDH